jgi:hypothetical protein
MWTLTSMAWQLPPPGFHGKFNPTLPDYFDIRRNQGAAMRVCHAQHFAEYPARLTMIAQRFVPALYVNAGADVTLRVANSGAGSRMQWRLNGGDIAGATRAELVLRNVSTIHVGTFSVLVSGAGGEVCQDVATVTVVSDARLTRFSVRGHAGPGPDALVAGFFIGGAGSGQVLLRGVGPALRQFGICNALANPELVLHASDGRILAAGSGRNRDASLDEVFTRVGAFALPAQSPDAALLARLECGGYSARIACPDGPGGTALAEVWEADQGASSGALVNASGRAWVGNGTGDLVIGFSIAGTTSQTVLIRGLGPSLGSLFGLSGALARTQVALFNSEGAEIAANSGWRGDPAIAAACTQSGACALPPSSQDSALLATLAPGSYTVRLSGPDGASGLGLAEVFDVPAP